MRTLNLTTRLAQGQPVTSPFVEIRIANLTYRTSDLNSGLRLVETVEEGLSFRATIEIGLPTIFQPFQLEALVGQKVTIRWGFIGTPTIETAPLRLVSVSTISEPGLVVTRFNCIGWWELLAASRTVLDPSDAKDPPPVWPGDTTIRNIINELISGKASVWLDQSDGIINIYKPHYEADGLESVLTTVRNLLDMTLSYIRLRPDGFHIVAPKDSDPITYTYNLGGHTFFTNAHAFKITMPNRVIVVPRLPTQDEDPDFFGVAVDDNSSTQLGFLDLITVDEGVVSRGEANTRASAILQRLQAEGSSGTVIVPMNIGQELFDSIRIFDTRAGFSLNVDRLVGMIRRTWNSGIYEMEIGLGGLTSHLSALRTEYPTVGITSIPSTLPSGTPVSPDSSGDLLYGPPVPPRLAPPSPPVSPWERRGQDPIYTGPTSNPPVPDPIPYSPTPAPSGPTPTYRPPPTVTPTPPDPLPVSPWERRYLKSTVQSASHWPESRTPILISPPLDGTSGRTYSRAIQTPGALGGRRSRESWFFSGTVSVGFPKGQRVKVTGGTWRPVRAMARVTTAPTNGGINVQIFYTPPGGSRTSIFRALTLTIAQNTTEAAEQVLKPGLAIPVGSIIDLDVLGGGLGKDLAIELDYLVRAVGQ